MKLKRKTIVLCSIGVILLFLSTQTTTGLVEYSIIKEKAEGLVDGHEYNAYIKTSKKLLRDFSYCGCENLINLNFSILCGVLLIAAYFFAFWYTILDMLYFAMGDIIEDTVIEDIFLCILELSTLPMYLLYFLGLILNCDWADSPYPPSMFVARQ